MTRYVAGPDGKPLDRRRGWGRAKAEVLLEAELERAERDGIPFDEGVQGSELALAGYLAGIREGLRIVRGEA